MNFETFSNQATDIIFTYAPTLITAIAVLIIGNWMIKLIVGVIDKNMQKNGADPSLKPFLISMMKILLKVMLIISVLGMVGIEMTAFIAILGAAGLAVGMALSGTLQNFAGGVMILLFKPFKVGDVIDAQGYVGSVSEIQIFNTILKTADNKTIIIPNGGLSTSAMTNYSTEAKRRVDWTIGVGYGDDLEKVRRIIKQLCDDDSRILQDPEVFIGVSELADSSVNFVIRAWVKAEDYWGVYFDMNKNIYNTFNQENITIPYPQMDVHMQK